MLAVIDSIPSNLGIDQSGNYSHNSMVDPANWKWGYMPSRDESQCPGNGAAIFGGWGGSIPYVAGEGTETLDNSSTIARVAGGLRFQTQATPSDNDDIVRRSIDTFTLTHGKMFGINARVKVSSAANFGVLFGVATSGGTELFTGAPADGLYFVKLENAATGLVLRAVENSNAAEDSTTTTTMADDTYVEFVLRCRVGQQGGSGTVDAEDVLLYAYVDGVEQAITTAMKEAMAAMLNTSAPTLQFIFSNRVNSTTQRNAIWPYVRYFVEG